jgi:phosphoribosyl 1,2-cyclic phosphodiesterase
MRFRLLSSGSKGNATLIQTKETTVLIDAGLPSRLMHASLKESIGNKALDALLITHEHSDHIKSVKAVASTYQMPIHTTHETFYSLKEALILEPLFKPVSLLRPFFLKDLLITPFQTRHDAINPVGYIIESEGMKLVHLIDTGYIPETDYPLFKNADAYIIESNYDVKMLFDSKRPYYLKKRIDSPTGHLSNHDASYYLSHFITEKTQAICFAHLSEDCNLEEIIAYTFEETMRSYKINSDHIKKVYAPSLKMTEWIDIRRDHERTSD